MDGPLALVRGITNKEQEPGLLKRRVQGKGPFAEVKDRLKENKTSLFRCRQVSERSHSAGAPSANPHQTLFGRAGTELIPTAPVVFSVV